MQPRDVSCDFWKSQAIRATTGLLHDPSCTQQNRVVYTGLDMYQLYSSLCLPNTLYKVEICKVSKISEILLLERIHHKIVQTMQLCLLSALCGLIGSRDIKLIYRTEETSFYYICCST